MRNWISRSSTAVTLHLRLSWFYSAIPLESKGIVHDRAVTVKKVLKIPFAFDAVKRLYQTIAIIKAGNTLHSRSPSTYKSELPPSVLIRSRRATFYTLRPWFAFSRKHEFLKRVFCTIAPYMPIPYGPKTHECWFWAYAARTGRLRQLLAPAIPGKGVIVLKCFSVNTFTHICY